MPDRSTPPEPMLLARIFFLAMVAAPVVVTGVVIAIRTSAPAPYAGGSTTRYGILGLWAVATVAILAFRRRIRPAESESKAAWWQANLPRVILLWAAFEAIGLLAGIGFLLTGDPLLIGLFLLGFLIPMGFLTPSRLSGG